MNLDEGIISIQQKTIENLKAELTYWKETAEYWKQTSYKLLKELNKTLDK